MDPDVDHVGEVNVIANEPLREGEGKTFYECSIVFNGKDYSITDESSGVSTDFLPSLEFIAEEIKELLLEQTRDWEPSKRDWLFIEYNSDISKEYSSSFRGYTCGGGSYLLRPLNDSEMKTLIKEVDSRLTPLFYEDVE